MTTRVTKIGLFGAIAVSFAAFACESGGVGDPCIPDNEYSATFGGFAPGEVSIEARSFQCSTRVCLINNFQGRVSCPYGAEQEDAEKFLAFKKDGDDAGALNYARTPDADGVLPQICRTPGAAGDNVSDYVVEAVDPQKRERAPAQAVYCSCRCANDAGSTDDGANYCECPSGFACQKLVDYIGLGDQHLAGSYCVRDSTQNSGAGEDCDAGRKNCTDGQYVSQ